MKVLEAHFGVQLFGRTTRGLVPTDEGLALAPVVSEAFERLDRALAALAAGEAREVVSVGAVGTFAIGYLMRRLADFRERHPNIDLRLMTNNNKVDLWTESLDFAIRFGDGAWHGVEAQKLMEAPVTPLCTPGLADSLRQPADLAKHNLLRSFRAGDWSKWLEVARVQNVTPRGPQFDSSILMVQAAMLGEGVALAPAAMFQHELSRGDLVQPFTPEVDTGCYWLTRLKSKDETAAMETFRSWLMGACTSA